MRYAQYIKKKNAPTHIILAVCIMYSWSPRGWKWRCVCTKVARWFVLHTKNLHRYWDIFEVLTMENFAIFYSHLLLLRPFGVFNSNLVHIYCGHLVPIFPFWYIAPRKIWQPRNGQLSLLRRNAGFEKILMFELCLHVIEKENLSIL
jgi:hypothetical protein